MADPFIGEVRIFAGNFAPRDWAFCNGQLLQISQNSALFSILGTTYGGDGRTTFAVPDLPGRAPMHPGQGPGLTRRRLGERGGSTVATLSDANMAGHTHTMRAAVDGITPGEDRPAVGNSFAFSTGGNMFQTDATNNIVNMATESLPTFNGGGQAHNNLQPLIALNFIIALNGLYPQRS